jgi:hypothetical protein
MGIPIEEPLGYAGVALLLGGFFFIAAGMRIIEIESVSVRSGWKTCVFGVVLTILGAVFLVPDVYTAVTQYGTPTPTSTMSMPTSTVSKPLPTDTQLMPTQISEPTQFLGDTLSPTQVAIEPTLTSELVATPLDVVERYYSLLNGEKYVEAWGMFSSRFQQNQEAENVEEYKDWAERVDEVVVVNPIILEQSDTESVVVIAQVVYHMQDGTKREYNDLQVYLKRKNLRQDWLIDDIGTAR